MKSRLACLLGCLLICSGSLAADPVALLAARSGDVRVQRAGTTVAQTAAVNTELYAGDTLITGADGRGTLLLNDESLVQVHNSTRLLLKSVDQSAGWLKRVSTALGSVYEIVEGELWFRNKNPATDLEIETPHVAIGVRGTEFVVRVTPDLTEVDMLEGRIEASNPFGSVEAISGEQVYASPGQPPRKRVLLNPDDAVQWTIVIPPLLSMQSAAALDPSGDERRLVAAFTALDNADVQTAVAELAAITGEYPDSALAWQAYALALLVDNEPDEALTAINQAVALTPTDANGYLIQSYIHQALFDLAAAQAANTQALSAEPDNVLALVNAGQLAFGRGDVDGATVYVQQALALEPGNADALNLSGFLKLAGRNSAGALADFDRALASEPAFAEAHLGRGLALTPRGDVDGALEAITTAVALDPTRSLYMSYWGRILYELHRHQRALQVLERAAELDPRDPTPWYLQAIVLRDLNAFGESIDAYNKAVALNDNRGVYRSRFLLDQDLSVRNVDLSIIFNEYSFNKWADRKAVNAVNQDYGNYSAHIMYAGALAEQEGRDQAFLSETLQARILQPSNVNSFNTFNQFTSLLDQPDVQGTLRTQGGSFNLKEADAVAFGALPEQGLGFQGTVASASTDGWNGFNGEDLQFLAGILKWDATLQDSFTLTAGDTNITIHDDFFRRWEYDDIPREDYVSESSLSRIDLGYVHDFRPGMNLMAYLAYVQLESDTSFSEVVQEINGQIPGSPPFFLIDRGFQRQYNDRSNWQAQLVFNARFEQHELIAGTVNYAGRNDVVREESGTRTGGFIGPGEPPPTVQPLPWDVNIDNENDRSFHNVFIQDTWFATDWLDLEGALYYEYLKNSEPLVDDEWTIKELNPRLGAVIRAGEKDTFRLAAYRYLVPFLNGQLSPTEVAGLTVLRNNQEGAKVKEADIGWERNWSSGFASINGFWMRNEVEGRPVPDVGDAQGPGKFDPPVVFVGKGQRDGVEMALNQELGNRWGLAGRYLYADVEDEWLPDSDRIENRAELELSFVHPFGVFVTLLQGRRDLNMQNRDDESMNYTDIELKYQFPGRYSVIRLTGRNIFDNNFNWVTDRYTIDGRIPRRNWWASFQINL